MLTRTQKEAQVAELNEKFSRAKSVYVADYRGLDVAAADDLRKRIRREGAGDFEYRVAKNAVLRRAVADLDVAGLANHFEGPTAVAISFGDPVGAVWLRGRRHRLRRHRRRRQPGRDRGVQRHRR